MKILVVLFLFMCSTVHSQNENENTFTDELFVKPGGELTTFEREWGNFKCTFTYQAQGGTHEKWQFVMERPDIDKVQCTVTRGATSYLHFGNFTLSLKSLTGPKVHIEAFEAKSTMSESLHESETKLDKKKRMVYAEPEKFKNQLASVIILGHVGKKKKEDL